jgi:hypothetical protein
VEEYGGGAAIAYGGVVYFSNFGDTRVYSIDAASDKGGEPVAVTPGVFSSSATSALSLFLTIPIGNPVIPRKQKPPFRRLHSFTHTPSFTRCHLRRSHPASTI